MDGNSTVRSKLARLVVAGGIVAVTALAPSAAFAGGYGPGDPGTGSGGGDPGSGSGSGGGGGGDSLPFTGGDVVGIVLIGAGAVAGGTALVRAGRRQTAEV